MMTCSTSATYEEVRLPTRRARELTHAVQRPVGPLYRARETGVGSACGVAYTPSSSLWAPLVGISPPSCTSLQHNSWPGVARGMWFAAKLHQLCTTGQTTQHPRCQLHERCSRVSHAAAACAGKETVNSMYGTRIAVLAGDFLFAESSAGLARLDNLEVRTPGAS